ncbi:MAG TPA: hypothetical protein GX523_02110 [Desulfitobacterium dehalogenans]|uniref:Uncharacterized protein n=1 Tax=Desulfitobacterium dehalogenans TaxID=36854 RepID=A0A7C6Z2L4_9FIRM|nr:hypothetical protein [Desulfitobacterium dehalogenans]
MLFVTRQPNSVATSIKNEGYYCAQSKGVQTKPIENLFGYIPIFVSSIETDEDLIVSAYTSSPSMIECYIVFETETFDKISYKKWIGYLRDKNIDADVSFTSGMEPEYFVRTIKLDEVKRIIPVKGRFNKDQDAAYMLSDDFYKEATLFERGRKGVEFKLTNNSDKFLSCLHKLLMSFIDGTYDDKAFSVFREEMSCLLK